MIKNLARGLCGKLKFCLQGSCLLEESRQLAKQLTTRKVRSELQANHHVRRRPKSWMFVAMVTLFTSSCHPPYSFFSILTLRHAYEQPWTILCPVESHFFSLWELQVSPVWPRLCWRLSLSGPSINVVMVQWVDVGGCYTGEVCLLLDWQR